MDKHFGLPDSGKHDGFVKLFSHIISVLILSLAVLGLLVPYRFSYGAISTSGEIGPVYNGSDDPWDVHSWLTVGTYAGDGSLTIDDGSIVNNSIGIYDFDETAYVGYNNGGSGTVTVTGAGSTWNNGNKLTVGLRSSGTVNIEAQGTVNVARETLVYDSSAFNGNGVIRFNNGILNTGGLQAASDRLLGTGVINTRGILSEYDLVFDATTGLRQQFILNELPGQDITINLDLATAPQDNGVLGVGRYSAGSMTIKDGIVVDSGDGAIIGRGPDSQGALTIDGPGSRWNLSNNFVASRSVSINIQNSGRLDAGSISMFPDADSVVNVTGPGSTIYSESRMSIGGSGESRISVDRGGNLYAGSLILGDSGDAALLVSGQGSLVEAFNLTVGDERGSGEMYIELGASVTSVRTEIGVGNFDFPAAGKGVGMVTVSGAGSQWNLTEFFYIGVYGEGNVRVENGGSMSSGQEVIIGQGTAADATVTVTGSDSTWNSVESIRVGSLVVKVR